MDGFLGYDNIKALEELFSHGQPEEEQENRPPSAFTPGLIGPSAAAPAKKAPQVASAAADRTAPTATDRSTGSTIREPAPCALCIKDVQDEGRALGASTGQQPLRRPKYDVLYKQAVTVNDAYLGMSEKDPSTLSCEELVLRVWLPGVGSVKELELDLQATHILLVCAARGLRLSLHLPKKVNEQRGEAKWDAGTGVLSVTAPIVRDDSDWGF